MLRPPVCLHTTRLASPAASPIRQRPPTTPNPPVSRPGTPPSGLDSSSSSPRSCLAPQPGKRTRPVSGRTGSSSLRNPPSQPHAVSHRPPPSSRSCLCSCSRSRSCHAQPSVTAGALAALRPVTRPLVVVALLALHSPLQRLRPLLPQRLLLSAPQRHPLPFPHHQRRD